VRRYFGDAAVLARKDLRLELRARDTLPAMLLFVIAILVVFHFALPTGSSRLAELGLLWVAIVFTALLGLGRAFVAEREQQLAGAAGGGHRGQEGPDRANAEVGEQHAGDRRPAHRLEEERERRQRHGLRDREEGEGRDALGEPDRTAVARRQDERVEQSLLPLGDEGAAKTQQRCEDDRDPKQAELREPR
jgi:hypothetical protein